MCPQTSWESWAFVFSNDILRFQRASLPVQPPTFSNDDLLCGFDKKVPKVVGTSEEDFVA